MKKVLKKMLALAVAVSVAAGFGPVGIANAQSGVFSRTDDINTIVSNMTAKQKIMQCMMIDFRKWSDSEGGTAGMTVLKDDVAELLADYQPGSVILFAENIKKTGETLALTKDMQNAAMSKGGLPLFMATDQEGGRVFRLGSGTALPGNMALGATGDPANAETAGSIIGRELESLGINTTLSPVMDVNNNANNPVIGLRSFSDDADTVGVFGSKYIAGLKKYDTIGCAKHFPGHGDTDTDSHTGLPVVDKSAYKLSKCELVPFQTAINQGIDMIMTAHILYPQIDSSTITSKLPGKEGNEYVRPATMSKKILTDLLRGDMGYGGVVVTDAMNMAGIADYFTMEQATIEALKAGADIICMPVTGVYNKDDWEARMDSIIETVEQEMKNDPSFAASIDESVTRILKLKKEKGILDYDDAKYTYERAAAAVGSKENRSLEREISAKAVTVVKNTDNVLPYSPEKSSHVLMLTPYENEKASLLMGFNRARKAGLVPDDAKVWAHVFSDKDHEVSGEIEKELEWADIVIINSEAAGIASKAKDAMAYDYWLTKCPKAFTEYCKAHGKKSVIISSTTPYDVQLYPDADAVIAVYGCKGSNISGMSQLVYGQTTEDTDACGPNLTAGAEVIFGVFGASGKLPVNIPFFNKENKEYTDRIVYKRGYGLTYNKLQPKQPDQPITPSDPDQPKKAATKLKKAAIKSLKAGKGKLTIMMTAKPSKKGGTHYRIAYKVKGGKKWKYKNTKSFKLTIKKLKANKKYVVKARAFKKASGKTYYGAWSKTKKSRKIK